MWHAPGHEALKTLLIGNVLCELASVAFTVHEHQVSYICWAYLLSHNNALDTDCCAD